VLSWGRRQRRPLLQTAAARRCRGLLPITPKGFQADARHAVAPLLEPASWGFITAPPPLLEELPRFPRGSKDLVMPCQGALGSNSRYWRGLGIKREAAAECC